MHGKRFLVHVLHYGGDGSNFYLRIDFVGALREALSGIEVQVNIEDASSAKSSIGLVIDHGEAKVKAAQFAGTSPPGTVPVACALQKVLELRLSLGALRIPRDSALRFQVCLWENGLPIDTVPQHGWLELLTAEPFEWTT
jgi:hypothetical protein